MQILFHSILSATERASSHDTGCTKKSGSGCHKAAAHIFPYTPLPGGYDEPLGPLRLLRIFYTLCISSRPGAESPAASVPIACSGSSCLSVFLPRLHIREDDPFLDSVSCHLCQPVNHADKLHGTLVPVSAPIRLLYRLSRRLVHAVARVV